MLRVENFLKIAKIAVCTTRFRGMRKHSSVELSEVGKLRVVKL